MKCEFIITWNVIYKMQLWFMRALSSFHSPLHMQCYAAQFAAVSGHLKTFSRPVCTMIDSFVIVVLVLPQKTQRTTKRALYHLANI